MNLIVIDLEWNQPMKPDTLITEPVPMYGEIIRIGAVRTDETYKKMETFQMCVRPKFYRRIHYMVKKVTGLDSTALSYGLPFRDAFGRLMEFCGSDPVFVAWGSEDEKVLRANMAVHGMDDSMLPSFIDLQIIFSRRHTHDGRQYGVVPATELLGLPTDLQAHDALNDAIYTYRIGRKTDLARYIPDGYAEILAEIEEEKRIQREQRYFRTFYAEESIRAAMHSKKITVCRCPECKK
ncbi:MAG: exonuclease domain-containing protein, partial [Oscillospiraceae bacterium]|nr:exonuclease domain-containing protein [Oscillospiraceae bacterium]